MQRIVALATRTATPLVRGRLLRKKAARWAPTAALPSARAVHRLAAKAVDRPLRPRLSAGKTRDGKLPDISLERLMQALVLLDQRVEIVRPAGRERGAGITVAA